jgi:hypothetical protein
MNRLRASFAGLIAGVSLSGAAIGQVFVEGVNHELPVQDTWTATRDHEQAFRWTPQNSFDLVQILWHCSAIQSGTIRVREDTGTTPGDVLREVGFSASQAGWNGERFGEALPVQAGRTYFVTFQSHGQDYRQFVAEPLAGHVVLTYYWTPDGGRTWNGPFSGGAGRRMITFYGLEGGCYPDCDGNETLDFFDFLCFQNAFLAQDPYADCDQNGVFDFFDFLCFQNEFLAGCP